MHKILVACMLLIVIAAAAGGFFLFQTLKLSTAQSKSPMTGRMIIPISTQSGDQAAAGKPKIYHQTIDIDSRSFLFSPGVFRVKMGEEITVNIAARGEHTFTIVEFGVNVKTEDGKKTIARFTPDKKGVFSFYCSYPGHRQAGQQGILIVE